MDRIGYTIKMNFADFYGADIEKREINGIMEDVLVLPMRLNGLYRSKKKGNKGIFMYASALPSNTNFYNQTHYLVLNPNKEVQGELVDLGHRPHTIFGFMTLLFKSKEKHKAGNFNNLDSIIYGDF